jgi:hypothetical protein
MLHSNKVRQVPLMTVACAVTWIRELPSQSRSKCLPSYDGCLWRDRDNWKETTEATGRGAFCPVSHCASVGRVWDG